MLTSTLRLNYEFVLASRDITQAYPQSKTTLGRQIIVHLPVELKEKFAEGTVLHVIKPLYGISEAGVHWFATCQSHHIGNLKMETSTNDPCSLLTQQDESFRMTGLRIDDTLHLGSKEFIVKEEEKLLKTGFKAKPLEIIGNGNKTDFNGFCVLVEVESLVVQQKGQAEKLAIFRKGKDQGSQFAEQRARGLLEILRNEMGAVYQDSRTVG